MNFAIALVHVFVMVVMVANRSQALPTPIGNTYSIDSTTTVNPNIDDAVVENTELEVKQFI